MVNLQFLGFPNYSVTEDGRVYAHHSKRFLKITISENHHDRYAKVTLGNSERRRLITVHRLVAFAYLPKHYQKKYVNHIDGNIHNNHVSNLEWCTALENNMHSIKHVRKPQFINNNLELPERGNYKERGQGRHAITEEEAIQYCEYMKQGYRGIDIKLMTGMSPTLFTVFKNKREHKYKYIADKYDFSHLQSQRLTTHEEVIKVCQMLQDGHAVMYIYKTLELPRSVVRGIASRKNYKEVSKDYVW